MARCLIGLGSNLGNRAANLDQAIAALAASPEIHRLTPSAYFATLPAGGPTGQAEFLNAAAQCECTLSPSALLAELQRIENQLGRLRDARWSARSIDLDLLLYDDLVIEAELLVVPHGRMAFRRFVLEPAASIAGDMMHPTTNWTVQQLLDRLNSSRDYLAITGGSYAERARAARQAATMVGAYYLVDPVGAEFETYATGISQPSPDLQQDLMLQRKSAIHRVVDSTPPQWVISDFWIGESRALASVAETTQESDAVQHALDDEEAIRLQKLLVLTGYRTAGSQISDEHDTDFERQLAMEAKAFHLSPLLTLPTTDAESITDEVTAAVCAMLDSK